MYLEYLDGPDGSRAGSIADSRNVSDKTSETLTYTASDLYPTVPNSNTGYCRYCLGTLCNGVEYWHYVGNVKTPWDPSNPPS